MSGLKAERHLLNLETAAFDQFLKAAAASNKFVYKFTRGRLGGSLAGAPVLFLTVTGRRTGKRRTIPLLYLADGDRIIIIASKGGDDRHPEWFKNLLVNPQVTVEIGRSKREMRASVVDPNERAALWDRIVGMYKGYAAYQRRTTREIPVIALVDCAD